MKAKNVSQAQIEEAALKTPGVRIFNLRAVNARGTIFRFQLKTDGDQYLSVSASGRKVGGAVNYFGHRDFLKALFDIAPEAVIETAFTTYEGRYDFQVRHWDFAEHNIGSQYRPFTLIEGCVGTVTE